MWCKCTFYRLLWPVEAFFLLLWPVSSIFVKMRPLNEFEFETPVPNYLRSEFIEFNSQMDWKDIEEIVSEAAESGDPVLSRVRDLRLDINHFSMMLWDPYDQVIF